MTEDPWSAGLARGWKVRDASLLDRDEALETDVAVVGTGAGGGICAEVLTQAGFDVVLLEEGPLRSSRDFNMEERKAYPDLYQESAGRKTKDKAINILQGRCVGGGTTVNWTSSFPTPLQTLEYWGSAHGVAECAPEVMAPWFEKVGKRLNIETWPIPPNPNNAALQRGAEKLGWEHAIMARNVRACANLGYCGMGCPLNAKQSMLVSTIPEALERGARLFTRTRAVSLSFRGDRVTQITCDALDDRGIAPTGKKIRVRARHFVLSGGAIGSPALLLRSNAPDPHRLTGARTFLHPVNVSVSTMPDRIDGFSGAPQSVYSDHFLWWDGVGGGMGFKLEVPPLHPLLSSTVLDGHGSDHRQLMTQLPFTQAMLSLGRDGFNRASPGGRVRLRDDGTPLLDYPFTAYLEDGMRRALLSMVELQFAAGATKVRPLHRAVQKAFRTWGEAKKVIEALPMTPLQVRVFSAHVMGGCPMGDDPRHALVNHHGRHRHLENLSLIDGSVFPTSIGSNPQVSIYAMSLKNATALVGEL